MNINIQTVIASLVGGAVAGGAAASSFVNLQAATPGTAQTGNIHVSGTVRAGAVGLGGITGANRMQVTSAGNGGGIKVNTDNGTGVLSIGKLTAGNFIATAPEGRGIVGDNQATSGAGFGGVFAARSTQNPIALYGRAIGAGNSGVGVMAENTSAGGRALVASNTASGNGLVSGTANDSLRTTGRIPRHVYTDPTPAAMVPLAYGSVESDGTITSGSGNFTVTRASAGVYDIDIQGVTTYDLECATVAMALQSAGDEICTMAFPDTGDLRIQVYNLFSSSIVDSVFYFVTFRAMGSAPMPGNITKPNMGRAKDREEWSKTDPAAYRRWIDSSRKRQLEAMRAEDPASPPAP